MGSCRRFGIHPEVRSGDMPSQFDQPLRGWLPRFDIPRGIIWMGAWRTLHPRRILHAPGAINVHGGFSPGEPRIRELRSRAERSTNWAILKS